MADQDLTIRQAVILGNRETDFFLGANSPILHERRNLTRNWKQFRSLEEDQFNKRVDFFNCTNQYGENQFEAEANWALDNKLWSKEALEFFNGKNSLNVSYIVNGRFCISTRFNSKLSGTVIGRGNWLYKAQDSIRNDGIVPDSVWPTRPDMPGEEYYGTITPEVLALGKEALKFYDWLYDFLTDVSPRAIDKALEHAPIQIALAVCPGWSTGVVPVCKQTPIHAVLVEDIEDANNAINILDHYQPYTKRLLPGYVVHSACRAVLYPKGGNSEATIRIVAPLYKDVQFGDWGDDVVKAKEALAKLGWVQAKDSADTYNVYNQSFADVVFDFQKANLSKVFWEMITNLKGRRIGPRTRVVINELNKFK